MADELRDLAIVNADEPRAGGAKLLKLQSARLATPAIADRSGTAY